VHTPDGQSDAFGYSLVTSSDKLQPTGRQMMRPKHVRKKVKGASAAVASIPPMLEKHRFLIIDRDGGFQGCPQGTQKNQKIDHILEVLGSLKIDHDEINAAIAGSVNHSNY
jgi:hypothetical protein